MRIPSGKQKICPGVYYTIYPDDLTKQGLSFDVRLFIRWYGFPLLAWKTARNEYDIKWYQYPYLFLLIIKCSFLWALGVR